jgi:hypothetical protein
MKSSLLKAVEASLTLAAAGLLAALLAPWKAPVDTLSRVGSPAPAPAAVVEGKAPLARAEPHVVLTLFVPRSLPHLEKSPPPREPAAVPVPEVKAVEAPWLSYLGYASGATSELRYYLKDTRSGRLITVTRGREAGDWMLVEVQEKKLIVRNKQEVFSVSKR